MANDGTITEAVSTMKWSGEAAVDVSIVNWIKGDQTGLKRLYIQQDNNNASKGWAFKDLPEIGSSLSFGLDVTKAGPYGPTPGPRGDIRGRHTDMRGSCLLLIRPATSSHQTRKIRRFYFPVSLPMNSLAEEMGCLRAT